MSCEQSDPNVVLVTGPVTGEVEVQVPLTIDGNDIVVAISFNRHGNEEQISIIAAESTIATYAAYRCARTRLRGMLATITDEHTRPLVRRCCLALDKSIQESS